MMSMLHHRSRMCFFTFLLLSVLCAGAGRLYGQTWTRVWGQNFDGQTYESVFASGADPYWANTLVTPAPPRNSLINGTWEVANTRAGYHQTAGTNNRFLMYWTDNGGPAVPAAQNLYFSHTFTNLVVGIQYRVSYRYVGLLGVVPASDRTNTSYQAVTSGAVLSVHTLAGIIKTKISPLTDITIATDQWLSSGYYTFTATATTMSILWENSRKTVTGNDFGIDDLLVEAQAWAVSGTVYNDNDGGTPNGALAPATTVQLLAADGVTVVATTSTVSGAYSFANVIPGTYSVRVIPPAGYQHVGSTDIVTPRDGTTPVTVATANITGVNFGINQPPTANTATAATQTHPGAGNLTTTVSSSFGGADPNSGSITAIRISAFPPNISAININGIDYTSVATINAIYPNGIPASAAGVPTVPIRVRPNAGVVSVVINYNTIDNAGLVSTATGSVTLPMNIPVPVRLVYFTVTLQQQHIVLNWRTAMEENHKAFVVQRSPNGSDWQELATIAGATGTVNNGGVYTYIDTETYNGNNLYRLKIVANDDTYTYSNISSVNNNAVGNVLVTPNPATEKVTLTGLVSGSSLQLFDSYGKSLALIKATDTRADIPVKQLQAGIYFIKIIQPDGRVLQRRFVKNNE